MTTEETIPDGRPGRFEAVRRFLFLYYPFTAAGNIYLGVSIYLLGSGFASQNVYAFFFSVTSIFVLILLAFLARFQAFRFGHLRISWETSRTVYAGAKDAVQVVRTADVTTFYFFRLHFALRGRFRAGRGADIHYYREVSASRGSSVEVPFVFPVSGRVDVHCRILLHDVFGFVRAGLGPEEHRRVTVHPPRFAVKIPAHFDRSMSLEGSKMKKSSEEEKFVMREYQPGDRLKDINWKASSRIQKLVTKISPQSPEPSKIIEVLFRTYSSHAKDTVSSIVHLDFARSWLLSFIAAMQKEEKGYRFIVYSSKEPVEVDSADDLERLSSVLASEGYSSREDYLLPDVPFHELVIFTTELDEALPGFLNQHPGAKLKVFRTVRGRRRSKCRKIGFLRDFDISLLPGLWIFRKKKQIKKKVSGTNIELHEQELCIRL